MAKGGGTPFIFRIFFFTKSCGITISIKSISRNDVLFAELGAMIISAKGGGLPKPPLKQVFSRNFQGCFRSVFKGV